MKKFLPLVSLMATVLIVAGCQEQVTPAPTQQTQPPNQTQQTTETNETQDTEITDTAPGKKLLTAHSWQWVNASMNDGSVVKPLKPTSFILKFNADGTMTSTTDCNQLSASYTVNQGELILGPIAATKKFCASNSQEGQYSKFLSQVNSFMINRGDLILMFKVDSGTMEFEPNPLSNPNL